MATEEPPVAVNSAPEPSEDKPAEAKATPKSGRAKKAKKTPAPKKARAPPSHPPYEQMIKDAIVTLKEKTGSSQYAITKFIEEKQKDLPGNFKKLLLVHLKKLVAAGKLVKVKNSFKLPPATSASVPAKKKPAAKASSQYKEGKKTTKTASKSTAKTKAKATAKSKLAAKAKPTTTKTKSVATVKPKVSAAAKQKVVAKPKAKASRTSPGKKTAAAKTAPTKAPAARRTSSRGVKPNAV